MTSVVKTIRVTSKVASQQQRNHYVLSPSIAVESLTQFVVEPVLSNKPGSNQFLTRFVLPFPILVISTELLHTARNLRSLLARLVIVIAKC